MTDQWTPGPGRNEAKVTDGSWPPAGTVAHYHGDNGERIYWRRKPVEQPYSPSAVGSDRRGCRGWCGCGGDSPSGYWTRKGRRMTDKTCENHVHLSALFTADMPSQCPPYRRAVPLCGACAPRIEAIGFSVKPLLGSHDLRPPCARTGAPSTRSTVKRGLR